MKNTMQKYAFFFNQQVKWVFFFLFLNLFNLAPLVLPNP